MRAQLALIYHRIDTCAMTNSTPWKNKNVTFKVKQIKKNGGKAGH